MGEFLLVYRLVAIGVIAYWALAIAYARRKPADWRPARAGSPFARMTRRGWTIAGILGIVAGVAILAFSVWLEASTG